MLAVSPLRDTIGGGFGSSDEFSGMLEDINFDELFMGLDDGDILPDLEVDSSELLGDFNVAGVDSVAVSPEPVTTVAETKNNTSDFHDEQKLMRSNNEIQQEEEVVSSMSTVKDEDVFSTVATPSMSSSSAQQPEISDVKSERKSSPGSSTKGGTNGKKKVKVDWTPELHRRFVQAVEQLGVDKAVPSRILEIMGVDCLTRHNIASHLQKYRSHRKHMLAREAEAASWSQRRQMYASAATTAGAPMREHTVAVNPWLSPTMGFPHPPPPHHHHMQGAAFRPLHVWGHPSIDQHPQPMMMNHHHHPWPRPAAVAPPSPPHARATTAAIPSWSQPADLSYWHQPHYPNATPCYPPQPMRFTGPPVAGVVPHLMYRPSPIAMTPASKQIPVVDAHPSKESIDAVVGDVLAKPWQPLPLGLKPPSLESVMGELQRQGVSKIPPTCA